METDAMGEMPIQLGHVGPSRFARRRGMLGGVLPALALVLGGWLALSPAEAADRPQLHYRWRNDDAGDREG